MFRRILFLVATPILFALPTLGHASEEESSSHRAKSLAQVERLGGHPPGLLAFNPWGTC